MLQQTQVTTVIRYFERFMARFPDLACLAAADTDEIMGLWQGLGYYARARNLHRAAELIVARHGGCFPRDIEQVQALPGIGRSTAGAILAQAFGQRHAILDGNVKRVLARHEGVEGATESAPIRDRLWHLAERYTPDSDLPAYTQAIMDLGATICRLRKPACELCPVAGDCVARRTGRTGELPTRPVRKAVPVRSARLLLVRSQAGVLLVRRPPTGIWGGLWSLPEWPQGDLQGDHANPVGCLGLRAAGPPVAVGRFAHRFTHFVLEAEVFAVNATEPTDQVRDQGDWRWVHNGPDQETGMPTPVRRFLENLDTAAPCSSPRRESGRAGNAQSKAKT